MYVGRITFFGRSTNSLKIKPSGQFSALRACDFKAGLSPILNEMKVLSETSMPFGTRRVILIDSLVSKQRETIFSTSLSVIIG